MRPKKKKQEIKKEVNRYFKKIVYNPAPVHFVPISGWHDDMLEPSTNLPRHKQWTIAQEKGKAEKLVNFVKDF